MHEAASVPDAHTAALLARAASLLKAGRPADALAPLREAVRLAPENWAAQHDLGVACLECGLAGEAVGALQLAVAANPRFSHAYLRLGLAWEAAGAPARRCKPIARPPPCCRRSPRRSIGPAGWPKCWATPDWRWNISARRPLPPPRPLRAAGRRRGQPWRWAGTARQSVSFGRLWHARRAMRKPPTCSRRCWPIRAGWMRRGCSMPGRSLRRRGWLAATMNWSVAASSPKPMRICATPCEWHVSTRS